MVALCPSPKTLHKAKLKYDGLLYLVEEILTQQDCGLGTTGITFGQLYSNQKGAEEKDLENS